jgi:oxalate decarboxylase/phosphoglucose isomerase-like protein (cupin superfamily)
MKTKLKKNKIKSAFTDKRGHIFDIWIEPVHHIGIVTYNKGVTRGKHYHKLSSQCNYLIKGKLKLVVKNLKVKSARPQTIIMNEGEMVIVPPNWYHSFTALAPSQMLFSTSGSRKHGSKDYEEDVFRIEI